ncbi:hypothetical protein Tco_0579343 [Tanacetum coccineum]
MYQNTAREESLIEVTAPPPVPKPSRRRQKRIVEEVPRFGATKNDAKRSKVFRSSLFNRESGDASINLNVDTGDDDEDDVHELPRPIGRDKDKGLKKKGVGSSGSSSSMNDEALARLMVSELATQTESAMAMKKEECAAFLEIKRKDVTCREWKLEI